MDELSKLGKKYGTDKIGKHNYLPVYYEMFKDKRNEVEKVLEIGVAEGAGLFMFRDFFPNATIYGLEIDIERVRLFKDEPRTAVWQGDQSDKKDLETAIDIFGNDLDLVVDDGSHNPGDQVFTALTLLPLLKKGVIYVIEDVANLDIFMQLVDEEILNRCDFRMVKVGDRYDDRLIILTKRQ